ncbi:hypothetical protein FA95DRAFT_1611090 [Auriscalpium vulgare]|uniref:Uncharacterized protein n=1 Tax=Auriscalpium vulgare TaxID=40419 RepID=A0ACB8RBC1_9AGAM|nr:hypothetical protein FA95DRAFT_1611090 [Auriscalpium vulgare]
MYSSIVAVLLFAFAAGQSAVAAPLQSTRLHAAAPTAITTVQTDGVSSTPLCAPSPRSLNEPLPDHRQGFLPPELPDPEAPTSTILSLSSSIAVRRDDDADYDLDDGLLTLLGRALD